MLFFDLYIFLEYQRFLFVELINQINLNSLYLKVIVKSFKFYFQEPQKCHSAYPVPSHEPNDPLVDTGARAF